MPTHEGRILTTHVGSLPRPPGLRAMLLDKDAGKPVDQVEFDRLLTDAVKETVQRQVAIGLDFVSDGEMGKIAYSTYLADRLAGYSGSGPGTVARDMLDFPDFMKTASRGLGIKRPLCEGPLGMKNPEPLRADLRNFKSAAAASSPNGAFMTAASPGVTAYFLRNRYYPSHEAYLAALVPFLREEYEAIIAAGFDLQLDCPDLAMARHLGYSDLNDAGFRRLSETSLEALNEATRNIDPARMRLHLCWGNYAGPHHYDLPLEAVLPLALRSRARAISFEGANPRHEHEWELFETFRLPEDRVVVPGMIDSATNFIEHPRLVAQRIERYARVLGRERVVASVDCGFGTSAGSTGVDAGIAWAKLESLVAGAKIASERLWRA
ncbi:MAG TPA: cobalamin-independent methionine synthase II family protein [Stellaceae bacterium]|nr:cobalamin-independent methionine synthase II family protein [Stellaceae bacterium]